MNTKINISNKNRTQICECLNTSLASMSDLVSQTKQAHWVVKGMNFQQLHELFDDLHEEVEGHVDTIAERIAMLGGTPMGTVRCAAKMSKVPEMPDLKTGEQAVEMLVDRYAIVANDSREIIGEMLGLGDQVTADIYIEITRALDKNLYFLEAHLR